MAIHKLSSWRKAYNKSERKLPRDFAAFMANPSAENFAALNREMLSYQDLCKNDGRNGHRLGMFHKAMMQAPLMMGGSVPNSGLGIPKA